MPLNQYKTQVLLLHSEQNTLDSLSASFSERYTVHCATSGTEALNIFSETPIHVIISAQNLPGMSGVEALREAKKRSPETVGILLAGPNDKNLEALVGEEEVFQIVRGGISSDELGKLMDNATRQMRLMALAESANDTRANPHDSNEHIIMETGDNGTSIITDATGTVPVLNPERISAALANDARAVDVLVLSKDERFLATIKESSRGLHHVHTADTLAAARAALDKHSVGVVLVDAGMVGRNVEKLTVHLRQLSKRLVAIVAGRRDDGEMLMGLINRGTVYRFLLKPLSPGRARLAIEASVKHHLEAPDALFEAAGPPAAATPETNGGEASPRVPTMETDVPNARLRDTLGEKESSLKQTMTGIVTSVGEALAPKDRPAAAAEQGTKGSIAANRRRGHRKILGGIAAAVALLGIIAYWALSGEDPAKPIPRSTSPPLAETAAATPSAAPPLAIDELLAQAREQRDAGQLYAPAGDNALQTFAGAIAASPANDNLAAEFADVVAQTLTIGEAAMLEGRTADAAAVLAAVTAADPTNPRLPFLSQQLGEMQLRDYLGTARAAILDSRYEDAASAIAAARALNPIDASDIDWVAAQLGDARRAEQADIASTTVLEARTAIDAGRFETAERLLREADDIDASSPEVAAAERALANARQRVAEQHAAAETEQPPLTPAQPAGQDRPAAMNPAAAGGDLAAAAGAADTAVPVAISTLTRTKYVAPRYPRSAERRKLSGWVDMVFKVQVNGRVAAIEVRDSEPGEVFVNAAVKAVEQWEFEPVIENDRYVEKRAGLRILFTLE